MDPEEFHREDDAGVDVGSPTTHEEEDGKALIVNGMRLMKAGVEMVREGLQSKGTRKCVNKDCEHGRKKTAKMMMRTTIRICRECLNAIEKGEKEDENAKNVMKHLESIANSIEALRDRLL